MVRSQAPRTLYKSGHAATTSTLPSATYTSSQVLPRMSYVQGEERVVRSGNTLTTGTERRREPRVSASRRLDDQARVVSVSKIGEGRVLEERQTRDSIVRETVRTGESYLVESR